MFYDRARCTGLQIKLCKSDITASGNGQSEVTCVKKKKKTDVPLSPGCRGIGTYFTDWSAIFQTRTRRAIASFLSFSFDERVQFVSIRVSSSRIFRWHILAGESALSRQPTIAFSRSYRQTLLVVATFCGQGKCSP